MLWIPGPTEVRPELLEVLTRPMIGHRSQAMRDLVASVDPGLRLAFGVEDGSSSQVAVGTHSATGMMEGALHGVGPRVLAAVNGAFSKRWSEVAGIVGKDVHVLEFEWGRAVDADLLRQTLEEHGPFDAVTVVANETSTGTRTPLAEIGQVVRAAGDTLLLTDVVSGIAGYVIEFDRHGVDFAYAGINKALALPPGLCVFAASDRYLSKARSLSRPSWYLDPVRTLDGHVARKTPATPAVALYRALAMQLGDIGRGLVEGGGFDSERAAWNARFARHARLAETTLSWAAGHGLEPFPEEKGLSPTVSCIRAGDVQVAKLIEYLAGQGHTLGGGYGKLKESTFRVGHMGDHTDANLAQLLELVSQFVSETVGSR